jgi:hypothetical protein
MASVQAVEPLRHLVVAGERNPGQDRVVDRD